MDFDFKQTRLLIHKKSQYALQTSDETLSDKNRTVEMGPKNSTNKRELWLLQHKGDQVYEIINAFTDDILTEEEKSLELKRGSQNKYQLWNFEYLPNSKTEFYLRMAKFPKRYVYLHRGQLRCEELPPGKTPDVWLFETVQQNQMLNRSCFIIAADCNKLIDVPEATNKIGEEIIVYKPNYRYNQRWIIFKAGQIYVIKNYMNELNLDVEEESFQEGTNIVQWPSHGKINQFWMFERVSEEKKEYRIVTCFDNELELGHDSHKLVLHKGKKFTWIIDGYFPE